MHITLSTLAIALGLGVALPNAYGLANPARFREKARAFPRSETWGYLLMLLGTVWFLYLVKQERISDFESLKPYLYTLFVAVGVGACLFLQDFLAVRGAAVMMLLVAKLMVDTARWAESSWRRVMISWAYLLVLAGMWFTVSPWRMRDLIGWATATDQRVRLGSAIRLAFGLFVALLGLIVF